MNEVGGDFYDFLVVDESHLGILVADVSGHGIPAAIIASMVKVAVASQREHASDPARVLAGMNDALGGRMKGQFVTAAYLYLDAAGNRIRYSAAGHPPLLRWTAGGTAVESIQQNGLALGFSARPAYLNLDADLQRGSRFLLYTDGLLEAHNEALEEFGAARLNQVISGDQDPGECVDRTLDAVAQWAGHQRGRTPEDDLTIIAIEFTGAASAAEI